MYNWLRDASYHNKVTMNTLYIIDYTSPNHHRAAPIIHYTLSIIN